MAITYGELPKRTKVTPKSTPYDLVALTINGKEAQGRPTAWDGEIVDFTYLLTADGQPVQPIRVVTMCPDCTAGYELEIPPLAHKCPQCGADPAPPADPFRNPFELLHVDVLDTDLADLLNEELPGTVADRLELD